MKTTLLSKLAGCFLEHFHTPLPSRALPDTSAKGGDEVLQQTRIEEGGAVARGAATASVAGAGPGLCPRTPIAKRECVQVTLSLAASTTESDLLSGTRAGNTKAQGGHNTTFRDVCVNIPGGGNRTHAGRREDVDCAHAVAYHSASHRADDPAAPRGVDEACGTCLELPEVYEVEDSEQPLYHDHDGRLDMVGAVTVDVLSVYSDDSSEETFCLQNDHLLELQLDRRNLVLDSLHPEIAPHIVITPPDDGWDYYWAIWTNRVGLQDDAFLTIQQEQSPCPYATLPPTEDADGSRAESNTQSQAVSEIHEQTISSHLLELQKVFSHSHFLRADRQAVFLNHIVVALWRQQYKAACIAASLAAASFRARWDSPKFVEQHEMSFRWTDPAEDLLAFFNHCPGTTIIDSVYPCTAPHIVIQEAPPPADPWALWANTTSSPQDYGYGQLLTIPSSFVAFVNVDYMSCADSCDGYCPTPDGTTAPSPPASDVPFPHTPDRDIFDPNLDTLDESMPPDLATEGTGPSKANSFKDVPLSEDMVRSGCDIFDEDDDGLPPFDEWYQDIAQTRTVAV